MSMIPKQSSKAVRGIQKGEAKSKKARKTKSRLRVLAITFFDKYSMVYVHYMKQVCKSEDAAFYKKMLKQLEQVHILKKQPQYMKERWKLHLNSCKKKKLENKETSA